MILRKNPNRFRATIGGFSQNLAAFHEKDGAGYKFVTDWIKKIDALNPQLAARTARLFKTGSNLMPCAKKKYHLSLQRYLKSKH